MHVDGSRHDLPQELEERTVGGWHHVAELGPFSLLDAVATSGQACPWLDHRGRRRDRDQGHSATIDLGSAVAIGERRVSRSTGPDVDATNSFEHPDRVGVREHRRAVTGHRFDYTFPAHSVSVLRVSLAP